MNRSFSRSFVWGVFISIMFAHSVWSDITTRSEIGSTTKTIESLKGLLTNNLELSTASTSITDRFCFEASIDFSARISQPMQVLVIRDNDRAATLVRTQSGECYTYCANGELLNVDHDHPGYLKHTTGNPYFIFTMQEDGAFRLDYGFNQLANVPQIMVNLNALLKAMIPHVKIAAYDEHSNAYAIQTEHSFWKINISPDTKPFVIKSLIYRNKDVTAKFSFLSCRSTPDACARLLDPATVEKDASKLHARIVNILPGDTTLEMLTSAFSVPPDLGKDAEESKTLSEFTALLIPPSAATQPTERR